MYAADDLTICLGSRESTLIRSPPYARGSRLRRFHRSDIDLGYRSRCDNAQTRPNVTLSDLSREVGADPEMIIHPVANREA